VRYFKRSPTWEEGVEYFVYREQYGQEKDMPLYQEDV